MSVVIADAQKEWWNEQPKTRQLLGLLMMLASRERLQGIAWNGSTQRIRTVQFDGSYGFEMVPPPSYLFWLALDDLQTQFGLRRGREIEWSIPMEADNLLVRIGFKDFDSAPHICCAFDEQGNRDQVGQFLTWVTADGPLDLTEKSQVSGSQV